MTQNIRQKKAGELMCPLIKSSNTFKIVTFYSFKGGAGRSLTTINTLASYVQEKNITADNPVLLIDLDIDSAGITYLCGANRRIEKSTFSSKQVISNEIDYTGKGTVDDIGIIFRTIRKKVSKDLLQKMSAYGYRQPVIQWIGEREWYYELEDYLLENYRNEKFMILLNSCLSSVEMFYHIEKETNWNCLMDISYIVGAEEPESVLFLGGDIMCGNTFTGDTITYYNSLRLFLGTCKKKHFESVFIDAASGRQTIAQVAHDVSTKLVLCMRMTRQFFEGTFNYLRYISQKRSELESSREIILLPVAVPQNDIAKRIGAKTTIELNLSKFIRNGEEEIERIKDLGNEIVLNEAKELFELKKKFFGRINTDVIENDFTGIPEVESFKWQEDILVTKLRTNKEKVVKDEEDALAAYRGLCELI